MENKLKILVLIDYNPFAQSNAPSNRILSLVEGVTEQGLNIDVLFINGYQFKNEKEQFSSKGTYKLINYRYLFYLNFSKFIIRNIFDKLFPKKIVAGKIRNIIKNGNYDYVWLVVSPKVIEIGLYLFKMKLNTKYIHERSEFSWIGLSDKDKLHKKYLTKFLPEIDVFAVMTRTLIDYYKEFTGKKTKIVHVPMTVDFSRFDGLTVNNDKKKQYIGYCGTMNIKKDGVDILINSFIKIMNDFPELNLYIAGPLTPTEDYLILENIVIKNNARNRILFLGGIPKEDMPEFLSNAHLLAMARPQSKQAEGGFPTKLGEYLATGKPVCITRVGEIDSYLTDNVSAFIAEPDSVDEFQDVLIRALKSKNSNEIGLAGRNVALNYFDKNKQAKILINNL